MAQATNSGVNMIPHEFRGVPLRTLVMLESSEAIVSSLLVLYCLIALKGGNPISGRSAVAAWVLVRFLVPDLIEVK